MRPQQFRDAGDELAHIEDDLRTGELQMSNEEFQHGDRVELTSDPFTVSLGTQGTITHLNGDGEPGTESYWPALDGDRVAWVEWDHAVGELGQACWTPKGDITKL